jgi:Xaa-Pro aminopeptidase
MWGGREFLVLRPDTLERYVVIRSTYDAEWLRVSAINTRVDSTLLEFLPPVRRFIEVAAGLTGGRGRIGVLNLNHLTAPELTAIREALPGVELMDLTVEMNRVRQIKSPFEIEAIRHTGHTLAEAMDRFETLARPGRHAAEVAGEVDGFLKGRGCFWGRVTYARDQQPEPMLPSADWVFGADDVFTLRLTHNGPHGYWCDLSRVFAFKDFPASVARGLENVEAAMREGSRALMPRGTSRQVGEAIERVLGRDGVLSPRSSAICESVGTDVGDQGAADLDFRENMVVALRPAARLRDGRGVVLCETFLVQPQGGTALSSMPSFTKRIKV